MSKDKELYPNVTPLSIAGEPAEQNAPVHNALFKWQIVAIPSIDHWFYNVMDFNDTEATLERIDRDTGEKIKIIVSRRIIAVSDFKAIIKI